METILALTARFAETLGLVLYGGPLLAFTCLLWFSPRISTLDPLQTDRLYRSWGAGLGIGMTLLFFGGFADHLLRPGGLGWDLSRRGDLSLLISEILFLLLLVSYTILEVWTNEPLRQLDREGGAPDPVVQARARARVLVHNMLNSILFLLVLFFWTAAGML